MSFVLSPTYATIPMAHSVFCSDAPFMNSCLSLIVYYYSPSLMNPSKRFNSFSGNFCTIKSPVSFSRPLIARLRSPDGTFLSSSLGTALFLRFFSPSSELVLMKASPSGEEEASRQISHANTSPYSILTMSPTLISLLSTLPNVPCFLSRRFTSYMFYSLSDT